jgi:SAM-dependent methyltransferase
MPDVFDARRPLRPVAALAGNEIRLLLVSGTLLFTELLLIRWVPANVAYVGFFSNFLLMASFLGIGLGILLGRTGRRLPLSPFAPLLLATVLVVLGSQLNVRGSAGGGLFAGLESNYPADVDPAVLLAVVVLVTAVMTSLALPLGPLLRSMPPLRAYSFDIAGSMAGIAIFTVLSAAGGQPIVWFGLVTLAILLLALGSGVTPWSVVGGAAMCAVLAIVAVQAVASGDIWSPYYRVTLTDADSNRMLAPGVLHGPARGLFVNGIPHHAIQGHEEALAGDLHGQIYRWFPDRTFDRVLIIGAGTGTDTALALARGAKHVDAVEIDPVIVRLGIEFHPDRPYQDPRVRTIVNDGRAFLNNTTDQYDLVVYALTDSLTLVTSTANVRLESFIYTQEALAAARDRLAPHGAFVMYNLYREPWLVTRLDAMVARTFAQQPLLRLPSPANAVIAAGPLLADVAGVPPGDRVDASPGDALGTPRPATDDWPFLYLRSPGIAPYYLVALAFLVGFAVIAVGGAARLTRVPVRRFSPHFFVLGVAFLLLETRSLVSFSLLFGTTWTVNALTFFAILASVLLAVFVNRRLRLASAGPLYVALFLAIGVAWLLPPEALLVDPPVLRYALAAGVAFAPVFFANLVFTHSFRDTTSADMAFASNLIGAMVGGTLEYVALITGFRVLLVVVAGLYAVAFVLARRWRFLADVDLVAESAPVRAVPQGTAQA